VQLRKVVASLAIAAGVRSLIASRLFSIFLLTVGMALSQARSSAVRGGRVVVVGATVVVLAAVLGLSVWPAHPPTNTTSRIETARWTSE
jgi:hypothetical protein